MKIFLSYPSEEKSLARQLYLTLRQERHDVFYADDKLSVAESFDEPIRRAISTSSLFLFFVTPESVLDGSYTLSEVLFAQTLAHKRRLKILPVIVEPTNESLIPAELRSILFRPKGNLVAEIAMEVEKFQSPPGPIGPREIAAACVVFLVLAAIIFGVARSWQWQRLTQQVGSDRAYLNSRMPSLSVMNVNNPGGEVSVTVPTFSIDNCNMKLEQKIYQSYKEARHAAFTQVLHLNAKLKNLNDPFLVSNGYWGNEGSTPMPSIRLTTTDRNVMNGDELTSTSNVKTAKAFTYQWLGFQYPNTAKDVSDRLTRIIKWCRSVG